MKKIYAVFGWAHHKLFKVEWEGHPGKDSWMPEDLLIKDGCRESIKSFWSSSQLNPSLEFYPGPDGDHRCWMCGWRSSAENKKAGLRTHIRRAKHEWKKQRARKMTTKDAWKEKADEIQNKLERHVRWGPTSVQNCWVFQYPISSRR